MTTAYKLPKDKKQSAEVLGDLVKAGRSRRNPEAIRWAIAKYYMSGYREFSQLDYTNGTVSIGYLNESGLLKLRYEEIVAKYQTQFGRLLSLDLSPMVTKKGISLDGVRKASVGQVVLDEAIPQDKVDKLKLDLIPPLLNYGTVGVGLWVESADSQGIEIIKPWELLPIPIDVSDPTDVRGLMRMRFVPVEWIKNLAITPNGKKIYDGIEDVKIPSGEMPLDLDTLGSGMISYTSTGGGFFVRAMSQSEGSGKRTGKKKDEKNVPITMLVEVWTETNDGYLAEYRVYAGMNKFAELYRYDHTSSKYHMPIRIIRDITVGSFWGRSYVDQLIPLNNELELALSSVFQAITDFDLYGLLMWPSTLGTPPDADRGQDGIKKLVFERDYSMDVDDKPFSIAPAKMTAPMIQGVNLAAAMMDRIANQPTEITKGEAPGRMDSGQGIGMLLEASSIPLTPTAKNIALGVSGIYRAELRILKDTWNDQKVVNITNLDDSLAGIVLDSNSGTMSLSQNAIPFPDEVLVTIKSEVPVSVEQQKLELKQAFAEQRITLDEFNWEVRKRGLDIPVGGEVRWQNYRRAMLENIILFGDGKTPGSVIISPSDIPDIHLNVIESFIARPEFFAASDAVRTKFYDHRDEHRADLGVYPDQMPYPEDTAAATLGLGIEPQQPIM